MKKELDKVIRCDMGDIWIVDWKELRGKCLLVSMNGDSTTEDAKELTSKLEWAKPNRLKTPIPIIVVPKNQIDAIHAMDDTDAAVWGHIADTFKETKKEMCPEQKTKKDRRKKT